MAAAARLAPIGRHYLGLYELLVALARLFGLLLVVLARSLGRRLVAALVTRLCVGGAMATLLFRIAKVLASKSQPKK